MADPPTAPRATRHRRGRLAAAVAVGYLVLVAGVLAFVLVDAARPHPDASFAGVWGFIVTLPLSAVLLLPSFARFHGAALLVGLGACGVLQAALLWLVLRGPRAER